MKKFSLRILSWVLAVLMLVSVMPLSVFAESEPNITIIDLGSSSESESQSLNSTKEDETDVSLPEVLITDITNTLSNDDPDLTFALNFAIKDICRKERWKMGSWYKLYLRPCEPCRGSDREQQQGRISKYSNS